jgi:hypothetical protein
MAISIKLALFYAAIVVAVLALLVCVYYVIPGYNHLLVSGDPKATHIKHVLAFAAVAVIAIIGALVTRPKSIAR